MYAQYGAPVLLNPNAVTLQAMGSEEFSPSLPPRLNGLISPDEYSASIGRCNDAKRAGWQRWCSTLLSLSGFVIWFIVLGVMLGTTDEFNTALVFGVAGGMIVLLLMGIVWQRADDKRRMRQLTAAVEAEHARYTAPGRVAPVSWGVTTQQVPTTYGYRRTRWTVLTTLNIEVGAYSGQQAVPSPAGGFQAPKAYPAPYYAGPPMQASPYYPQQQQSQFGQTQPQFPAHQYAPHQFPSQPTYAAAAYPVEGASSPAQPHQGNYAPPLGGAGSPLLSPDDIGTGGGSVGHGSAPPVAEGQRG